MKLPISYWESIIRKGIEEGLSGNRILQTARSEGLKIRTQTFYEIFNAVRSSMEFERIIKDYPEDKPLTDRIIPSRPVELPTKYQFIVEAEFEGKPFRFGIYSDKPLSPKEIREMSSIIADEEYGIEIEPEAFKIVRASRRKK